MAFKAGASRLFITPYYDDYQLPGVQEVAGDGLSVISIKESHRKCKITPGLNSKQPEISCAQGMKARNSFRNLLKPDLRKVKRLECSTTGSVTQLLRTHNLNNPVKTTFKKRISSILQSLVRKKPKAAQQTQDLPHVACTSLPEDTCILSIIRQTSDSVPNESVQFCENFSVILNEMESDKRIIEENVDNNDEREANNNNSFHLSAFTMYKSVSTRSSMRVNTSNNTLTSYEDTIVTSGCKEAADVNLESSPQPSIASSNIPLKTKKSIIDMTIGKNDILAKNSSSDGNTKDIINTPCEIQNNSMINHNTASNGDTYISSPNLNHMRNDSAKFMSGEEKSGYLVNNSTSVSEDKANEIPSSEIVQSIFTEMFTEIQEIEDYISSYVTSFCTREEEFQNYPALTRKSSEVVSHFFEQVHSSIKVKTDHQETNSLKSATSKEVNNTLYTSVTESHAPDLMSVSISEVKDKIIAEEINHPVTDIKIKPEDCLGYCYWDDMDTTNTFSSDDTFFSLSTNHSLITGNYAMHDKYENALVPSYFFEEVWFELVGSLSRDIFAYNTFTDVYDESILAEAKSVLDSINMFMDNECFPSPSSSNRPLNTCTIVEIEDIYDQGLVEKINLDSYGNIEDGNRRYWDSINETMKTDIIVNDNVTDDENEEDLTIIQEVINLSTFNKGQSVNAESFSIIKHEVDDSQDITIKNGNNNGNVQINPKSSINTQMKTKNNQAYKADISRPLEHPTTTNDKIKKISAGVIKNPSNIVPAKVSEPLSLSITQKDDSDVKVSAFVQNTEKDSNEQNSNLLFSSPCLQLNLTNPLLDFNKK